MMIYYEISEGILWDLPNGSA